MSRWSLGFSPKSVDRIYFLTEGFPIRLTEYWEGGEIFQILLKVSPFKTGYDVSRGVYLVSLAGEGETDQGSRPWSLAGKEGVIRWPECLQQTTSFPKESVYTSSSTTIRVQRVFFSEHGWCSTRWSKMLLHLSCRPQLQISDTHHATGLSGRKQKDPKGLLQTPTHPNSSSLGPKSSYY